MFSKTGMISSGEAAGDGLVGALFSVSLLLCFSWLFYRQIIRGAI